MRRVLVDARKARDWGIGSYIRALLAGLAGRGGYELIALGRGGDEELFPPGVLFVRCDAPHYSVSELLVVRREIARTRPDLFHAPHYVVPLLPPHRTVVTIHDLMHLGRPEHAGPLKRVYAKVMLGRAVRSAARILVNSEATRAELVSFAPRAAGKIRVTPPALDPRFFQAPPPESPRAPYLLFVGNDKPHKNLEGLLRAIAGLDARLVLAGGPEFSRASRAALAARLGVAARVEDRGFVDEAELLRLVAGARALVLPSFAEGFGLPALEAQALGTPVVCSDRPALREATGGAALFADPASPETFTAALLRLLADPALRSDLSSRGRANAALHTRARLAEETAAVYDEVLA